MSRDLKGHARKGEAAATVALLSALDRGEVFAENVKRLVRAARAMLDAFEKGEIEFYTSGRMEDALAPFNGFTDNA